MIKTQVESNKIIEATCDCCGKQIRMDVFGRLEDHMKIGGYSDGKLLEAAVCIPCMEEKLGFIDIQKKDNPIGYC